MKVNQCHVCEKFVQNGWIATIDLQNFEKSKLDLKINICHECAKAILSATEGNLEKQ